MRFEELGFRPVVVADKFGQGKVIYLNIDRSARPEEILKILQALKQGKVSHLAQTDTYVFDSVLTTHSFSKLNKI